MISVRTITQGIYNVLKGVTDNVFPLVATEGTNTPFIVFERSNFNERNTKDGDSDLDVTFSIKVVTATYFEGLTLVDDIREDFHHLTTHYNMTPVLVSSGEEYTTDGYVQTLNFSL